MRLTGMAKWCEERRLIPGDEFEYRFGDEWATVRLTGVGKCAVLARRPGAAEFACDDRKRARERGSV